MAGHRRRLAIFAIGLLPALPAKADGMFTFEPYVNVGTTYDDNVFRVSGKDEARALRGDDTMSDTSQRMEAGIGVDLKLSRQHILLQYSKSQTRFDRFDFLDYDGESGRLAWNWQLGNHLNGELSVSEDTAMSGFEEVQNRGFNLRTRTRQTANIEWEMHPRWRLRAVADEIELENSNPAYRFSDRNESIREVGVQYRTPRSTRIGLFGRQIDSEYAQREESVLMLFGNQNRQRELGVDFAWTPGGKSRMEGRVAKVERKYEELSGRDFSGWAGRASVFWQLTGKTAMNLSASRDIYAVDDLAATYVKSDLLSLSPSWSPTSKISVQGRASYERREYQGDPALVIAGLEQRADKVRVTGLTVSYVPYYKINMQLSWQKESRDSSVSGAGYDANSLSANIRAEF